MKNISLYNLCEKFKKKSYQLKKSDNNFNTVVIISQNISYKLYISYT